MISEAGRRGTDYHNGNIEDSEYLPMPLRSHPAIPCGLLLYLLACCSSARADGRQCFVIDMAYRQLMLDDFAVLEAKGARKVYFQAIKAARPILTATHAFEKDEKVMCEPHVYYDPVEKILRMWYWTTARAPVRGGWITPIGYAESKDGLEWTKPVLGLVDFKGDRAQNNILSKDLWTPTMLPVAKPGEHRFMFIDHHGQKAGWSRDGRKIDVIKSFKMGPVPNAAVFRRWWGSSVSDGFRYMYDPVAGIYRGAVKAWAPIGGSSVSNQFRRVSAQATSPDLVKWTFSDRLLEPDLADDAVVEALPTRKMKDEPAFAEIEQMTHFRYEGLILAFPNMIYFYDNHLAGWDTGQHLCWSHDFANWSRPRQRYPFLPKPVGTPDWGFSKGIGPLPPLRKGGELWFYHDVGNGLTNDVNNSPRQQWIALSKLRVDGWAAYEAGPEGGWVDTQRLKADGELKVNADCKCGELRVEVFEVEGKNPTNIHLLKNRELPGFGKADCEPITGDRTEITVAWKNRSWADLKGKQVKLRFHLRNAKVFSFWTKPGDEVVGVQNVQAK